MKESVVVMTSLSNSSVALSSDGISTGVRESHLEQLVNFSQCSDNKCEDMSCVQLRKDVHNLEVALRKGAGDLDPENMRTLRLLHEHYSWPCSLPSCRVPWCRFMAYRCPGSPQETVQTLTTLLNHPMLTLLPQGTLYDEFIKLDPDLPTGVAEWKDWQIVCPLSRSHTVALATPLHPNGHPKRWVVKMTALHEDDNQLHMLRKLEGLVHPHIIGHVWAASCDRHNALIICTEFLPGRTVRNVLDETKGLSYAQARLYFLQVLYAAQRLHELNMIFLNWKCSNLLLDAREPMLKVSNFGTSVDLARDNADIGTVKLTLPGDIVPAEMFQNERLSHKTDSWGLACIVHEMLTGVRPWYHLRHQSHECIRKEILENAPPDVSPSLPECVRTLTASCLQKCPDSRLSVAEMVACLHAELD